MYFSRMFVCLYMPLLLVLAAAESCVAQSEAVSLNASSYASFNEAVAALVAAGGGTLVVDAPSIMTASVEAPPTVLLQFAAGGSIDPGPNVLALNCRVDAEARQIFYNVAALTGTLVDTSALPQWFGAKADGATDDSLALQTTLNLASGGRALIPKGDGPYKTGPLSLRSGVLIDIEAGTVLEAISGLPEEARLINIADVTNVHVNGNGATVRMLKNEYSSGEQRHAVDIVGSNNVTIENLVAKDSGGDGFYVGPSRAPGGQAYSKDVNLFNCVADNNRRQGLSIVSGENILAYGCSFMNTSGTDPQSGVDLEPDSSAERLVNISLISCRFVKNKVSGLVIALTSLDAQSAPYSVKVINCLSQGNAIGVNLRCVKPGVGGEVLMQGVALTGNSQDYLVEDCPGDRPEQLKTTTYK